MLYSRKASFSAEAKLLLGISGGSDSVALYLFSLLRSEIDITLLAIHINHQLRGEESRLMYCARSLPEIRSTTYSA